MQIKVKQLHNSGEAEKESWKYEVEIPEASDREAEVVTVQMNCDTIVCSLDGYAFKTYSWTVGNTAWCATISAIKYIDYCFNS